MQRRRYLALLGAAVGTAGCGGGGPTTETGTESNTPTDTQTASATPVATAPGTARATEHEETETGVEEATEIEEVTTDRSVTVRIGGGPLLEERADAVRSALSAAGLPDRVSVAFETVTAANHRRRTFEWLTGGGDVPDLLFADAAWSGPVVRRGGAVALDRLLSGAALDFVRESYDTALATASAANGRLGGVPVFVDVPTIQYRADLVDSAGVDADGWATEPLTWQRFATITDDVRDSTGTRYGYLFQSNESAVLSCCVFTEAMTSWGGAYFGDVDAHLEPGGGREVTVQEEPTRNAIRMLRTFLQEPEDDQTLRDYEANITPDDALGWRERDTREIMLDGNAVMHRGRTESLARTVEEFGSDVGATPMPYAVTATDAQYPGTGGSAGTLGGRNLLVNPRTDDVQEAALVAAAMLTDEFQFRMFEAANWVPARAPLSERSRARTTRPLGPHLDAITTAVERSIPRPSTDLWYRQETNVVQDEIHTALRAEQSPDDAAIALGRRFRSIEG